jgi:hypothetical protein
MKIRKSLTAVGAALIVVGISAPAMAEPAFVCEGNGVSHDPETIFTNLRVFAEDVRCKDPEAAPGEANPGIWDPENPIWEKRREESCEIHSSLARKLHEDRELDENSTKPPKNRNNDVAGAAWDFRNQKYEGARDKLYSFINDAWKARLNSQYEVMGEIDELAAAKARMDFIVRAEGAISCVNYFIVD